MSILSNKSDFCKKRERNTILLGLCRLNTTKLVPPMTDLLETVYQAMRKVLDNFLKLLDVWYKYPSI